MLGKMMSVSRIAVAIVAASLGLAVPALWAQSPSRSPIVAGEDHTCALTNAGAVSCWGRNLYGQLGDGSVADRDALVDVVGLAPDVVTIAAGPSRSCALTLAGGLKCWGYNGFGQLGDNSEVNRTTPVDVGGLETGVSVIAGGWGQWHSCAALESGGARCWGYDADGQLGDAMNPLVARLTPVPVADLSERLVATAVGERHSCAVTMDGGAKCWGANDDGQLGDGTTVERPAPVDISGLASGVSAIAAGLYHTCALTNAGGVKCWGYNGQGQLGNAETSSSATPVDVTSLTSGIAAISAGQLHTCGLTVNGGVKCWGYNAQGQLGDGSRFDTAMPVSVVGLESGVSAIAAGGSHTCALLTTGRAKCWGANNHGQLGNQMTVPVGGSATPVDVHAFSATDEDAVTRAVEYLYPEWNHYFITANADEIDKLDAGFFPGWVRTGYEFNVYRSPVTAPPRASVCRFFSTAFAPLSSHFYTSDPNECAIVKEDPNWTFEGLVFSVDKPTFLTCPVASVPIYRLYNDGQGGAPNHRYTSDLNVQQQMKAQGWIPEGGGLNGVVMCSASGNPPTCKFSISPIRGGSVSAEGGGGTVSVLAGTRCNWTAAASADWITITGGASGSDNGSVGYTIAPNPGAQRAASISIAGMPFSINQNGR